MTKKPTNLRDISPLIRMQNRQTFVCALFQPTRPKSTREVLTEAEEDSVDSHVIDTEKGLRYDVRTNSDDLTTTNDIIIDTSLYKTPGNYSTT